MIWRMYTSELVRQRWRILAAALKIRRGVSRWRYLTLAFYNSAWIKWTGKKRRMRELMARIQSALADRRLQLLREGFEAFSRVVFSQQQGRANAAMEARARLFLRSHPFIKTPAEAFLAGLSATMELTTLLYVKARPLTDANLDASALRRPQGLVVEEEYEDIVVRPL
ncbi:hypothetical protein T484DRAFT_1842100, partial [Baffinella frigidus]